MGKLDTDFAEDRAETAIVPKKIEASCRNRAVGNQVAVLGLEGLPNVRRVRVTPTDRMQRISLRIMSSSAMLHLPRPIRPVNLRVIH